MPARVRLKPDPWEIREAPYQPDLNIYFETNFTLGNGYMAARGRLEEGFGEEMETYPGTYIAGVFDHFEGEFVELVNVPDFFALTITIGWHALDLRQGAVEQYSRVLNMREGTLTRSFIWTDPDGKRTRFYFQRFFSLANVHLACHRFRAVPLNHQEPIRVFAPLDGEVFNRRQRDYPPIKGIVPNYHLDPVDHWCDEDSIRLQRQTKTTGIDICQQARMELTASARLGAWSGSEGAEQQIDFDATGGEVGFDRFIAVYTSRDAAAEALAGLAEAATASAKAQGYDALLTEHVAAWAKRWEGADIVIDGDPAAQQGIRFNIFQLIQANARWDPRASLAAKLLSHTRYKGNAFWDTEIFMFPFFLYTDPAAARNLLLYRYHMLPGARAKAKRLGLRGAMYPWMSAHDGSEQCDSWEYGDCEIHITADIAYAIDQYLQVTGDNAFLVQHAAEIYIETARFWADRVAWNPRRKAYTIGTVKGPDEYCAITNNNMYTNYLAAFNLALAEGAVARLQADYPAEWQRLADALGVQPEEVAHWRAIREGMYQHWDKRRDLLIQDDTFLDKPEFDLTPYQDRTKPVLEIIGYERAMRVRILRQTDALLLMYLLNDKFTEKQKRACFRFYEPLTTHDSSLSYNTHCIMAAELGMARKAAYYFDKTCRLDLDDELDTARSGLHGASLGGTWQSVVNGFAGVRVIEGKLALRPLLPRGWQRLAFQLQFQGRTLAISITKQALNLRLLTGEPLPLLVRGREMVLAEELSVP